MLSDQTLLRFPYHVTDLELVYISEHTAEKSKPVYAPYNPFMAAWFKYR